MSNTLECGGFPAAYPTLSGQLSLNATHRDFTLAMLAVGYPSHRSAVMAVGYWRAILLRSMLRGYLDSQLCSTSYFRNLERSEKGAMSFLMAQAFTYWFAQTHMGMRYVVHVQGARQTFTPAAAGAAAKPGAGQPKLYGRPDFIGRSAGAYHVFESKGRSSSVPHTLVGEALAQVSMIAAINGQTPTTRVAACFSFQGSGVTGRIQDPPEAGISYELTFDDVLAARKVYAFFLDPEVRASTTAELIPGFQCVDLGEGIIYGIDSKLLPLLDELEHLVGDNRTTESLLALLNSRQSVYAERRDENTSVAGDGTILRGMTALPVRQRRIRRRIG